MNKNELLRFRRRAIFYASAGLAVLSAFTFVDYACGESAKQLPEVALNAHQAVTPVPQNAQWWRERLAAINQRIHESQVNMIFVGDSITQMWENAPEIWNEFYGRRSAVNMGFSGDTTQNVLWRLQHGQIEGIAPKLAVVMIGTNNSNGNEYTASQISDGIVAICQLLRKKLPETKILLLAIFPRGATPSAQREKNTEASRLASRYADGRMIHYMDINSVFLERDKTLPKPVMGDYLHPAPEGYRRWARAIEPKINELLGN
jgi:beta-glucosidase